MNNNNNKSLHEYRGAMLCKSYLSDITTFFLRIDAAGETESTTHTSISSNQIFFLKKCSSWESGQSEYSNGRV